MQYILSTPNLEIFNTVKSGFSKQLSRASTGSHLEQRRDTNVTSNGAAGVKPRHVLLPAPMEVQKSLLAQFDRLCVQGARTGIEQSVMTAIIYFVCAGSLVAARSWTLVESLEKLGPLGTWQDARPTSMVCVMFAVAQNLSSRGLCGKLGWRQG